MMEYQDDDVGLIIRKTVLEYREKTKRWSTTCFISKRRDDDILHLNLNIASMFTCRTNCITGNIFA